MDKLFLREIVPEDKEEILEFLKEFAENGSVENSLAGVVDCTSFEDYLRKLKERKEMPFTSYEQEKVPGTNYLLVRESDNRIVGSVNIRFQLNRMLDERFGGHIGYGIRPTERRKGYATEALKLALDVCRKHGLKSVKLGCLTNNIGSRKTILNNGGKLINHKELLIPEDYYEINL